MLFRVLGPLEARTPAGAVLELGARKPTRVLAALLLNPNGWTSVAQLIGATWHEQAAPASAEANLKTYIWQLRRVLPGDRIESRPGAYRLRVEQGELETDLVAAAVPAARRALAAGDALQAAQLYTEALARWRGRPFDGLEADFADPVLARLEDLRFELRLGLADAWQAANRFEDAIALLHELTDENPLREAAWARLVRVLHRAGRRDEAITAFGRARTLLSAELGIEPGPELNAAFTEALEPGGRRRCCDLPRDLPTLTGREAELDSLRAQRRTGGPVPVLVVDGMAGVGKTALAVRFAHEVSDDYPDARLFVDLRARNAPLSPEDALARLLRAAGVPDSAIPAELDERAALWRGELAGRKVLLVLDDAAEAAQVVPLLPGTGGCLVLVTTRNRALAVEGARGLTLAPLDAWSAAEMFRTGVGDWRSDAEPAAVAELVGLCGGLPAALRAAAARLRSRPLWTVGRLVTRLAAEPLPGMAELLEPSCRRLAEPERRLFAGLGRYAELDVQLAAKLAGLSRADAVRALESLADRHLVDPRAGEVYACHPAVRSVAAAGLPARVA
ncbi:AfsR/SARP family transcriptional regulator [Amycolatopsis magusensis]|uniref:DNA-binding SARP family transcriptional activator n=1 Tax=Amycolatopsis magusensis TaxID=882444 RepID=A0ABS4PR83_9PSEU|nr:BTAD domain-containing putative transcriptional regulator [Amycolatopsis magusensis]MBP2181121.1 DNA-binding SARP family transcriptional activator [Amycolatopsis magusensis]